MAEIDADVAQSTLDERIQQIFQSVDIATVDIHAHQDRDMPGRGNQILQDSIERAVAGKGRSTSIVVLPCAIERDLRIAESRDACQEGSARLRQEVAIRDDAVPERAVALHRERVKSGRQFFDHVERTKRLATEPGDAERRPGLQPGFHERQQIVDSFVVHAGVRMALEAIAASEVACDGRRDGEAKAARGGLAAMVAVADLGLFVAFVRNDEAVLDQGLLKWPDGVGWAPRGVDRPKQSGVVVEPFVIQRQECTSQRVEREMLARNER